MSFVVGAPCICWNCREESYFKHPLRLLGVPRRSRWWVWKRKIRWRVFDIVGKMKQGNDESVRMRKGGEKTGGSGAVRI